MVTGHSNRGCHVGGTGATCEKGHDLTIKNVYIFKTFYISTYIGYLSHYNFIDNNLFSLAKRN